MTNYKGYLEHRFETDEAMANFYEHLDTNTLGILTNQYAVLYAPEGGLVDKVKWDGEKHQGISARLLDTKWSGKIRPLNLEQELAFDLLNDRATTVKLLTGRFGSGKTFLMSTAAVSLVEKGKYDKIIYLRNNVSVKDVPEIGFLPGDTLDKLIGYAMPLADAIGGKEGLSWMIDRGKIDVQPLGMIRGRDFKHSIVYCSECENLTKEHMQLILGRIGEGSALWLDGDRKQVDKQVFDKNSGLDRLIDVLKGNRLFGYVQLMKTERSETAALADLLD